MATDPIVPAPAPAAGEIAPVAPAAAAPAETVAAAPLEPIAPVAPAADAPAAAAPGPAPEAPAAKPAPEFAPSLLDEAAKPAADAKPAEPPPAPSPEAAKEAPKADETKPPAAKEPAPAPEAPAPIEYAFTYPEGFSADAVDSERMGAFTGILNEGRVPPEAGQKLLDLHLAEQARVADAVATRQWEVFSDQQKKWRDDVAADPEIGGARHETALTTVMQLVDAYGDRFQTTRQARDAQAIAAERKELLDVFRQTGAANNRLILGLLHFAGEKLREGTARPAPPPRGQAPNAGNRGLNRYRGSGG